MNELIRKNPSLPYVLPFVVFLALLGLAPYVAFLGKWEFPLRIAILCAVLWVFSRDVIDLRVLVDAWARAVAEDRTAVRATRE